VANLASFGLGEALRYAADAYGWQVPFFLNT
jgi:hypothetical protein